MCKIRRLFLFLTTALFLGITLLSALPVLAAGAQSEDAALPVIDGTSEKYSACFTVENGKLTAFEQPSDVSGAYAVRLPSAVSVLGEGVFSGKKLKSVTLPDDIAIERNAFGGCALLSSVEFVASSAEGEHAVSIGARAFAGCWALRAIELPKSCNAIAADAFDDCPLQWVYLNAWSAGFESVFAGDGATLVFTQKKDYVDAVAQNNALAERATFLVNVVYHAAADKVLEEAKLHGRAYSLERTEDKLWRESGKTDLPVQHESYASTVWYRDGAFAAKADLAYVNARLSDGEDMPGTIDLYAHATLPVPDTLKTVSHAANQEGYALSDREEMCTLLGMTDYADKGALVFSAYREGGQGAITALTDAGSYLVTVSLSEDYGVWKSQPMVTVVIEGDSARTMQIMLLMLSLVSLCAVILSITLVLVRSRSGKKKRRDVSSEELIDRYIASGGRTRLKK